MERLKKVFENKIVSYIIYVPLIVCVFIIVLLAYLFLSFVIFGTMLQLPSIFFGGYEKIPHVLAWTIGVFSLISGLSVVLVVAKKLVFEYMEDKKRKEWLIYNKYEH